MEHILIFSPIHSDQQFIFSDHLVYIFLICVPWLEKRSPLNVNTIFPRYTFCSDSVITCKAHIYHNMSKHKPQNNFPIGNFTVRVLII